MWGNNSGKGQQKPANIDTLIGQQTQLQGDLVFSGILHIDGSVKGNVSAAPESAAMLTLSEQGSIEGEVQVPSMILNGTIIGDVHSSDRIELTARARITGNIYYNLIEMAMGAEVNGQLIHRAEAKKPVLALDHELRRDKQANRPQSSS
ncbi:MAG: bactofilin family protein [Gammaproteobacteria bacterium]